MPKVPPGPFTRDQLEALASGDDDRALSWDEQVQLLSWTFQLQQVEPWASWVEAYARRLYTRYLCGDASALTAAQEAFALANDIRLGREAESICPKPEPPPEMKARHR